MIEEEENIWYQELQDELDEVYDQQEYIKELEIMLLLQEKGYKPSLFDTIIQKAKDLGYTHNETLKKIRNK